MIYSKEEISFIKLISQEVRVDDVLAMRLDCNILDIHKLAERFKDILELRHFIRKFPYGKDEFVNKEYAEEEYLKYVKSGKLYNKPGVVTAYIINKELARAIKVLI